MRSLRPYQEEMLDYARRERHPVFFVEMRLGKTIVAIRRALELGARRILVTAPNSALGSWETELQKEGIEDFEFLQGTRKQRKEILEEGWTWNLINKEGFLALPEIGKEVWDLWIMDESASIIRYPQTKATRFYLNTCLQAKNRILLTGRPDPLHTYYAYWTQMAWANGGEWMNCWSYWQFRAKYFKLVRYDWIPRPGVVPKIREEVAKRAFVLRRADVGMDVPKAYHPRIVHMPADVRRKYAKAETAFALETEGGDRLTQYQIVKHQWLRQLCSGFIEDALVWNGKLKALKDLLTTELEGEKVVVCCTYLKEMKEIEDMMMASGISWLRIDGGVPQESRREYIQHFQSHDVQVLLSQVRCIETGADLGVADTMIFYSPPFSPLTWAQVQERILGNLQKAGALIIMLMAFNTIEEDIYLTLDRKDLNQTSFLEEVRRKTLERRNKRGAG